MFQVIPAIDLMNGTCVRLQQGDASRKTEYAVPPPLVACGYEKNGARRIHVVDLDGAFAGEPKNLDAIRAIRQVTKVEIEVGGGIRSREAIETLLNVGINYVVIGTKAVEDEAFLREMLEQFGQRIILGADARNGFLSTRGWTSDTPVPVIPFLTRACGEYGLKTVIFTDIARDGMFTSPNYDALGEVLSVEGLDVIASGGVGSIDDVRALAALNKQNLAGVIVGKALYDGRLSLREALAVAAASAESSGSSSKRVRTKSKTTKKPPKG